MHKVRLRASHNVGIDVSAGARTVPSGSSAVTNRSMSADGSGALCTEHSYTVASQDNHNRDTQSHTQLFLNQAHSLTRTTTTCTQSVTYHCTQISRLHQPGQPRHAHTVPHTTQTAARFAYQYHIHKLRASVHHHEDSLTDVHDSHIPALGKRARRR